MKVALEHYKITQSYRVHWSDMNAAKHVSNLVYLRWGESARIHYFEEMAKTIFFDKERVGHILRWQDCKYIFPMTYPDTALVGIRVAEVLEDRFMIEMAVFSKKYNRIAAIIQQSIVPYDYIELKKIPVPSTWAQGIERIEGDKNL